MTPRQPWLAVLLALAACGGQPQGEPVLDPPALISAAERDGERVFMANCNECHPQGGSGLAPGVADRPVPGFLIRRQVRNGFGAMPAFDESQISDEELDHLVQYIRALRERY